MKRLFDVVASGLGLLVLSPLFLIVAVWIKADFPGPVFYLQVRVGRHNKDFRIFKFRSMRMGVFIPEPAYHVEAFPEQRTDECLL